MAVLMFPYINLERTFFKRWQKVSVKRTTGEPESNVRGTFCVGWATASLLLCVTDRIFWSLLYSSIFIHVFNLHVLNETESPPEDQSTDEVFHSWRSTGVLLQIAND